MFLKPNTYMGISNIKFTSVVILYLNTLMLKMYFITFSRQKSK